MVAELVPMTELNFDKDDVAAIAIAEAEKTMRQNIKTLHAQISDCEKAIENANEEIQKQGEIVIETKLAAKIKRINAGLKATKVPNFTTDVEITINSGGYKQRTLKYMNGYVLRVVILNKDDKAIIDIDMAIERNNFPPSQLQIAAMKRLDKLKEQKTDLVNQSMDWRKKLGDMPTLERQIKAMLARDQVERTKDGKALVAKLLKNFDGTLKLLGGI